MQSANAVLSVDRTARQYFSTLCHKGRNLREKNLLNVKCVFWLPLQLLSKAFLNLRGNKWGKVKNVCWSSSKELFKLVRFNETWIFCTDFRNIFKYQISGKSAQWEPSCSMRKDGQTRRSKYLFSSILQTSLKRVYSSAPWSWTPSVGHQ